MIEIMCTGRATHPRRRLGFVVEVGGRSPVGTGCEVLRDADGVGVSFQLRCARCHRTPRRTFEQWDQLVARLDAAGLDTLDISELAF